MTSNLQFKTAHDSLSARATTVLRVVVAVSLAAACFMVLAQTRDDGDAATSPAHNVGEVDLAQLERIFWACDHAAATDGVDGPTGIACGNATEELKLRKFNGDFELMLFWWQDNKAAMYQALSQARQRAEEEPASDSTAQADDYPMP